MWAQGRLGAFFCICLPRRAVSSAECRMDVEGNHRGDHTNHDDTEHQCRAAGCISTHRSSLTHIYSVSRPQAENWELMRTRLVSSLSLLFLPAVQFHFFLDLLNITFPPASIFCLPSSRRSSVCRKTTLRFRSHARWPKPNLPHPPQMCVCFSHMSVSLYICMCVCVLKLVLQNASGWTHTIEHEARSVCASGVFSWVQLNLSWLWEASGLFNKLWAAVWRLSAGLTPRWRNYTCCKDEEEKKEKKRLQWNRKLEHFF